MRQSLLIDQKRDRSRPRPRPAANDLTAIWREAATGWFDAVDSLFDVMTRELSTVSAERCRCGAPRGCGCGSSCDCCDRGDGCDCCDSRDKGGCRGDSCHCRCCIGDADLVVYVKLGEVRVVPIRIENPRRRQREITLQLSDFSTSGGRSGNGGVDIEGRIVSEPDFVIEACDDHIVTLVVAARESDGTSSTDNVPVPDDRDVDDCTVAYADLRVDGCDIRPVRIAVAVVPRDCDTFDVGCGCGCC